jgi:hypothetical protein
MQPRAAQRAPPSHRRQFSSQNIFHWIMATAAGVREINTNFAELKRSPVFDPNTISEHQ